jgi:hypothetical protein
MQEKQLQELCLLNGVLKMQIISILSIAVAYNRDGPCTHRHRGSFWVVGTACGALTAAQRQDRDRRLRLNQDLRPARPRRVDRHEPLPDKRGQTPHGFAQAMVSQTNVRSCFFEGTQAIADRPEFCGIGHCGDSTVVKRPMSCKLRQSRLFLSRTR